MTPEKSDKKLFQTGADDLSCSGRGLRTNGQRGLIRVVQPAIQITAGFLYSPGKKTPVCIVDIQNLIPEKSIMGLSEEKDITMRQGAAPSPALTQWNSPGS